MSATTERLLLQILELEERINESLSKGEDVSQLEETLLSLKNRFASLNEALIKPQGILKG
jgi:hypothetical protein